MYALFCLLRGVPNGDLLHGDPPPGDDGDPPLVAVLVLRQLQDAMPPQDVDVLAEGVHGAVGLGHRDHLQLKNRIWFNCESKHLL